jgi:hypothetical protein
MTMLGSAKHAHSKIKTAFIMALVVALGACQKEIVSSPAPEPTTELVRANLSQLMAAQDAYAATHGGNYFAGTLQGQSDSLGTFVLSPGVKIVVHGDDSRWSAVASGLSGEDHLCAVYINMVRTSPPAQQPGVIGCA